MQLSKQRNEFRCYKIKNSYGIQILKKPEA